MIRRPPRSTQSRSSAASDVYKRQGINAEYMGSENARSNELLVTLRKENDMVREQLELVRKELYGAQKEKNVIEMELGKKGDRMAQLQHELDQSALARDAYRSQLDREGGELSKKNQELISRIQELDNLHRRYEDAIRTSRESSPVPVARPSARLSTTRPPSTQREQR
eukprot:TRINITY_DN8456_c0_g1_i4.p1 TRINITY_DN8456_c0_g1~~TRINITY_DN8456_c0_g1_i4.p1  ORF type:complete len:168 (+),score=61.13 TRINITY_DN8456_c0_g1_i4:45-548(+)